MQAKLTQALIVDVRDSTGRADGGKTVRFQTLPPDDVKRSSESAIFVAALSSASYAAFSTDVTDSLGRARALIAFGTVSGTARVRVSVPEARIVVLVNSDDTGCAELASSNDASRSAHKTKGGNNVVFYQGTPDVSATVSIVQPGAPARVLAGTINGFASAAWPRLSPDGAWVYFVGTKGSSSQRTLWRIHTDGTQLDSIGTMSSVPIYTPPGISPNGQNVAMEDANSVKIFTIATKTFTTVSAPCGQPHYSPDGTTFGCIKSGVVSVMNVDGSGVRQLTKPGTYDDLSSDDWSPDGGWLIVRSQSVGPQLVNAADGTQAITLSALGQAYTQLSFVK